MKAGVFYNIWVKNNKCGYSRMNTITGLRLDKLIAKFKRWVDPERR